MEHRTYKIRCRDGAREEVGYIVGPFGVALNPADGFYRVTHLHSGLKVSEIGARFRDVALSAANELAKEVPIWSSHKPERIAEKNGMSRAELARIVNRVAKKHGCDGHEDERISL